MWKICSFLKLKLSEHHPFSKKLDLPSLRLSNFSHNNPTQPHLGKPRPVQVHNHHISNHHPKWRALKIPVLDHISISKRWRRCHQRHCLSKKKRHVFLEKKKTSIPPTKNGWKWQKESSPTPPSPKKKGSLATSLCYISLWILGFGNQDSLKVRRDFPSLTPLDAKIAAKVA